MCISWLRLRKTAARFQLMDLTTVLSNALPISLLLFQKLPVDSVSSRCRYGETHLCRPSLCARIPPEEAYLPPYRRPVGCISRTLSCPNTFDFRSTVCRFECHASRARRTGLFTGFFTKIILLCLWSKLGFMANTCLYRDHDLVFQPVDSVHDTKRYLVCKVRVAAKTSGSSQIL